MTAVDRPDNGQDEPELIARCGNYREDLDQSCTGQLRYRWGMIQAACDTCGGWCGVAAARWTEVASGRAGAGEQQRELREAIKAERSAADLAGYFDGSGGTREAYETAQRRTDELLALLGQPAPASGTPSKVGQQ